MLKLQFPAPVKLICGFLYQNESFYLKAKTLLEKKLSMVDFQSQPIDFDFTDYYQKEMGGKLIRRFISFKTLISAKDIVKVKLYCLKLEKKFAPGNKRLINIDPGYLNEAKLVLATTKDFSHRLYLSKGIYAEVTLAFKDGVFSDFPSTFPDYKTKAYKDIFHSIRAVYRDNLGK